MQYMNELVYIVTWYMAAFAICSTLMNSIQHTINVIINIKRPTDYLVSLTSTIWACFGVVLVESRAIVLGYEEVIWSVFWWILSIAIMVYIIFIIKNNCSLKSCFFVGAMYLLVGIMLFMLKTGLNGDFDTNGSVINASIEMVFYCIGSKLFPLAHNVFVNIERNIWLKH